MDEALVTGKSIDFGQLGEAALQDALVGAVRAFAAARRANPELTPFPATEEVTAADAVTLASALLEAVQVELFEVQLWRSWGEA